MKNTIISQVSSHFYAHAGCNEALSDINPSQISSNLNSSLCMDHVDFSFHSQFPSNYYHEYSGSSIIPKPKFNQDDDVIQSPYPCEGNFVHQNARRKRSADAAPDHVVTTIHNTISHSRKKKRSPIDQFQQQFQIFQRDDHDKFQLPRSAVRRRSQKLTDKITALQKLVSPYGKTDTASVLFEACISIKALQHQIQNLFDMSSAHSEFNMRGGEKLELQSRGLCLVPVTWMDGY